MSHPWLAARTAQFDSSGIRKVFDLAAKMNNPINMSIGQPDFAAPEAIKEAAIRAIRDDRNGYSLTQGIPELRAQLQASIDQSYGGQERSVLITSGTSGALVLAILAMVDPGDEVIIFDPYFVMYPALVSMVGGRAVLIDTYPNFQVDVDKVAAAITPRTKLMLFNSPGNPTGAVAHRGAIEALAKLAATKNIALLSDEIYREFCYGQPFVSPATWNDQTIVVDGFSKTYGVTGWRLGWVHGPPTIVKKMAMIQQFTFVCPPHPLQWGALAAMDIDMSQQVATYAKRRDQVVAGLSDAGYEVADSAGAFYVFPKVPDGGSSAKFVSRAIDNELLIIPGAIFSGRDTHFRISYAVNEETIQRGLEVLRKLR